MGASIEGKQPITEISIGKAERRRLFDELVEYIELYRENAVLSNYWSRIENHLEVGAMLDLLEKKDEAGEVRQSAHLRKMIALQVVSTPADSTTAQINQMLVATNANAGGEITTAKNFREDFSDLPKVWKYAMDDVIAIQTHGDMGHDPAA